MQAVHAHPDLTFSALGIGLAQRNHMRRLLGHLFEIELIQTQRATACLVGTHLDFGNVSGRLPEMPVEVADPVAQAFNILVQ